MANLNLSLSNLTEKKQMQGKIFVDSNVILYLFTDAEDKKYKAYDVLVNSPTISIQVLNELSNILFKKYGLTGKEIKEHIDFLLDFVNVSLITISTINLALDLKDKYKYSYYDSLIIATAIENNCSVLYTEDMQDGQVIEGKLKIVNPFIN